MIFLNCQFFEYCPILRANEVSVLAVDDCILLAVEEDGWHLALPDIPKFDLEWIVLELTAILLR
jgi:hypothetical protein